MASNKRGTYRSQQSTPHKRQAQQASARRDHAQPTSRSAPRQTSSRTTSRQASSASARRPSNGADPSLRVTTTKVADEVRRSQRPTQRTGGTLPFAQIVAALAVVGALVGVCIGVYWSNLFAITEVTVEGVEHLTATEMTQLANVPSNTTLLRVDTATIKSSILRDAWVSDVKIERVFPNTLNLVVTEREIGATVEISVDEGASTEVWAISVDGIWLCEIPDEDSEEAASMSSKIYEDVAEVFVIKDVAYGVEPEVGQACDDESILNALYIVTNLTTELKDQVKTVSATSTENTTLTLESNIEIAFGAAEDIRDKERVCLEIMEEHEGEVSYINVRVVDSPTWRAS